MGDQWLLRPVAEDDLPVLDALTNDPDSTGPYAWFGWSEPGLWRRRRTDNGLLTADGGTLMVTLGADRLGFVAWRKVQTTRISYCWNIGIELLPHARGHGYGTEAQRLLASYLFAHTRQMARRRDLQHASRRHEARSRLTRKIRPDRSALLP